MSGVDSDLVRSYWQQTAQRVGEVTDLWLGVEEGDPKAAQAIKRLLHTMKGEAHMLGLRRCGDLLQLMEDVVARGSEGEAQEVGDAFLTALDAIAVMATMDGAIPDGFEELVAQLSTVATNAPTPKVFALDTGDAPRRPRASSAPPPVEVAEPLEPTQVAALDPHVLSPLVHEARRLHREQALLLPEVREIRRMLRALLAEMDPSAGLESLAERIVKTLGYGAEVERRMADLSAAWSTSEFALDMALDQIEETVRASAMVSVGGLKAQVHRAGRATAKALGKEVRVTVTGDAYVDATVERSLGPALLHLVRNAVDHGIEHPDDRRRHGKPTQGRVDVQIQQTDSSVRVVLVDDGAGVDVARLRAQVEALEPGFAGRDDEEVLQRIFEHGVSTRDTATDISGRGIGLDVVAREVGTLGGTIRVKSTRGEGTRFELVLPTMLRADVVVPIEVHGSRLALPSRAVLGVERIREVVHGTDGWRLPRGEAGRAELVPLFDLGAIFDAATEPSVGDPVVVVQHRTGSFAARVDRADNPRPLSFERIEELPIRSDIVRGIAPAPDGNVVFLLDTNALYDVLRGRGTASRGPAPKASRQRHVLVVEDAPVARELLLGLLRSFSLRVSDAADGRQGLRAAQQDPPDLILTDIEMPFLGGLEMIAELRRIPELAEVPVVVLSTRTDEESKARAVALGVRYFLSKQRFVESELRQVVDACLER